MPDIPRSLYDAIISDHVHEFLTETKSSRLRIDTTSVSVPLKEDGSRYKVTNLTSIPGMDLVTLWENIDFHKCSIHPAPSCRFENCTFRETDLHGHGEHSLFFIHCELHLSHINARHISTEICLFKLSSVAPRPLVTWKATETEFHHSFFYAREILESSFRVCTMRKCVITSIAWREVTFNEVAFKQCEFETSMQFDRCSWTEVSIDRETLESLGDQRGGLSDSVMRKLMVVDPISDLRLIFGGSLFYIHVIAMTLFFSQYVAFIFWKLLSARASGQQSGPDDFLITSLFKFAFLGLNPSLSLFGIMDSLLRSTTFLAFSFYNAARLVLVLKSLELEHKKAIVGIWPEFSTSETATFLKWTLPKNWTWLRLMHVVKVGTIVAVISALYQLVSTLLISVPE